MGGGVWKTLAVHRDINRLANLAICRFDDLAIWRFGDLSIWRFEDEKKMFFEDWRNKEKMEISIRVLLCKQKLFGRNSLNNRLLLILPL